MVERMPSAAIESIDMDKCYFNPGCAMSLYKPELPDIMLGLLRERFGSVKMHRVCCHHDPGLPAGLGHHQQLRRLRPPLPQALCGHQYDHVLGGARLPARARAARLRRAGCLRTRLLLLPLQAAGARGRAQPPREDEPARRQVRVQPGEIHLLRRQPLRARPRGARRAVPADARRPDALPRRGRHLHKLHPLP